MITVTHTIGHLDRMPTCKHGKVKGFCRCYRSLRERISEFSVSQEIVTPESAEHGDFDSCATLRYNLSLRDAIVLVRETRTTRVGGVESISPDSWPMAARIHNVTITNGMEFETGACESRTLSIPFSVTPASSRRIARLLI